ncbi:Cyclic nucleotide-binding protein [Pseudocohnilembus persalinus]|uniref:Cyclic nucleotide-binding protein n=1 Tax=Pseudocohnilembus persalinus TaxID=266149 RepID=A0A0V0R5H2_PSEPJ|nr:Cyclic nucleotide-binding protein [Pseudocohnilembus persalinus]|eukprot:KRX09610.1 Cyclic nucleotide-binding protein [Pseudocohnilembus persalinus]
MDNKNWLGISKKKLKHDRQQSNHPFLLDLDSSIEQKTNRQLINLENRQSISSENKLQDSPIKSQGHINKQKKLTYKQNVPTINILPSENCETDIALITIPNQEQQITQNEFIQLKQQQKIVNSPQNSQNSDDKNYPQLYQNINDKNSQENIISFPKEQLNNQNQKQENQQNYKQSSPQIHLITDILEKMSLHSSNSQQKYNKNDNNTTPQNPQQINETEIISQKNKNPAQKQNQKSLENKNNYQNKYPKQNDFNLLSPQTNAYQINNYNTNNSNQTQSQKNIDININLNQDFKQQLQQGNNKINQSQSQSQSQSQFLFKKQSMPSNSQFNYNQSPRQRNGSSVCSYQNTGNNTVVKGGKRPTQLAPNPQAGQNLMGTSFMGRSFRKFTPINIIQNKFSQQNNNMISSSNNINRGGYMIFCVAHLFGLGFIYVTKFENYGETWIDFRDGSKAYKDNDFSLYIDSLYFAFITMITVGYGDINPVTPIEKIYGILITLISCGIFGYALNVVGNILQHIQERNATVKKEKYLLLKYLEKKQINKNLQVKVIKYLDFVHQMEKEEVENSGGKLLNKISKKLKNEVLREYYLQILCANTFLIKYFSIEFLNTLAISMKDKMYGPEEIIFSQNEIDSRLIFLTKGELEVKFNKSIFNSSTKSRFKEQYSHIYFDNFERLVKQFPSDFERFQMLKEDIRQGLLFPEKCFLCFKNWDHNGQNLQNNYYLSHQHQHMLKNYYSISNSLFDENQQNEIITIKTQTNKPSDTINPNKIQQNKFTHFKIRKKLHAIDNCYLINYIPNKQFLLNQYNDSRFCGQQMSANFENYYQPTPFQQPRNQSIRKSNSVNRKMKFRDFSHYKINQSVRKYRVENALQITFNQEELDEDFKNVDDREFLTSIPVIQIWDEVIRLKYIEANFPQDYQEEDIPIIQDRLFEYNEENQFQNENQYGSQTGSNFDSSDIENQIPYFSSQDDLQNVQKFQQFNRQNNMQLSQKNIPLEEPYDSQSSEGDFNSDSIVSPQTQNKQTIKKQPAIQNETSNKNQSLTKSKCKIGKTVNLLGSSGSIGTIESAVSEDRTEHDVKNLMQQKLQSRQQTIQTQEQLPKISQNLQNSKNLKNSMTNSKTQPPKKLLTLNDSQFFERNQNEHLFSFSPDQLAFSKQQVDTEIPQLKLNQLAENQQQDIQQQTQDSQKQFQLDQQQDLEQNSQQFENFELNQIQAKIPTIEQIKRQSQKQLSNLTLYRSKNNNQNDYNIRLIKDKEENQRSSLQRSNSSIDSFNFNQSFKKSNFSQQSYKRAQTKEIVNKPSVQKNDTFYDYVNKVKNNSFSKNSSKSSINTPQKQQNQEKNVKYYIKICKFIFLYNFKIKKSPFDSNNVSILEISNPFTQPNKNQIYKSQEIKSNQKTLQSSHKNYQKTQIDYQPLSTEQKDLQQSQKLSSPNKNEENYFTNTQEFTIYNNESEIASKKILDLQTDQNTQKTQKTSQLKKNLKSSHKSPHSNITQYPEREIKPSLKKKPKISSSLQSQQIKNKIKQTAPNPNPNPKKNPFQLQQQQQQQNSKKNPSQQQNSSQKFSNSRQSNKSLTQQPQTKTVQILLSQKYHNPNPYPNPNPNLNPSTSDSQKRPQKSFLRQNTVSQFSYTPKSTTALQFSLNQASKTTNINNSPTFKNHKIQQNLQNFQNRSKQNQRKSAFQNQLKLKKGSTNENIQPPAHINSSSTVNESQYQIFNFLSNNNMLNKNSLQILTDQKNMKGSFQQQIKNKSRSLSKNTILQQQSPLIYNNYKNFQTQQTDPLLFEKNLQNMQNQQKPEYIIGDLSLNNNSKFALNQHGNCDGDYEVLEKNFKDKQKQLLQYITDNFDRVKSYKVYRRQANITNIIQKIEQIQIKLYQHNQNPQLSQQNNQNIESCQSIRTYRSSIQPQNQSVLRKSKYYYKSNNNIPNSSIKQQSQNTPSSNNNNYQFEDVPKEDGISGFQQYENQKNNRNQDNQQNPQNDGNQILKRNSSSNNDPNCLDDLLNAQDQIKMQQSENPSQNKQLDAKINQQLFTINSLNASCQNNLSNNSKSNNTESKNKNKNKNQYQIQSRNYSKNLEYQENSFLQKQAPSKQSQSQNQSQIQAQNNSQQTFSQDLKQSKKNINLQPTSPQKRFSHNVNPNSLREQRKRTFIASKTDKNISSNVNINAHFNVNKSNMTNNSKSTSNNNVNNVNKIGTLNNSNSNKSGSKNNVLQFPNSQKNEKRRSSVFDIIEKKKLQILVQKYQEQDTQFKDTPRDNQKSEKLKNQQKQQSNYQ